VVRKGRCGAAEPVHSHGAHARTRMTHSWPGVDGHTRVFVRQRRRWVASVARVGERVAHGAEGIVATRCK
jgi:hypothetical protein